MSGPGEAVRAKDLFDLKRVLAVYPLADEKFWRTVATEFALACKSRYVDCAGIESFSEALGVTRATYDNDATIPRKWTFEQAWGAVELIAGRLAEFDTFPLHYPLSQLNTEIER